MAENTNPPRRRSLLFWVLLAVLLVVLVAGLAVLLIVFIFVPARVERSNLPSPALSAVSATAAEVEQRYGAQVTLVALTAGGGPVDVRFRVTDPAKASFPLEAESVPALVFEKTGTTIQPREALDQDSDPRPRLCPALPQCPQRGPGGRSARPGNLQPASGAPGGAVG